ncbi:MAG: LppU/SCO3897 family protein [Acidimicrobiales bacterium]
MAEEGGVSYRGISWQRTPKGRITWYDDDQRQWRIWRPGGDAPPLPPDWAPDAAGPPPRVARAGWTSPYRLVPLVLAVVVIILGIVVATSGSGAAKAAETKAAEALLGKCLPQNGTFQGHPRYGDTAVTCSSPAARVKIVQVLPGTPGSPQCPSDTTRLQLGYAGVQYPHQECAQPLGTTPTTAPG